LESISESSDFEEAKKNARRATNALEDAAMDAADVECSAAYVALADASTKARHAQDADEPIEFLGEIQLAIRSYNEAIRDLEQCMGGRKISMPVK